MSTNDEPTTIPAPEETLEAAAPLGATSAATGASTADASPPAAEPDDSAPAPAPANGVDYADEYVVPDPATQAALDDQVPDNPVALEGDGDDEGDD